MNRTIEPIGMWGYVGPILLIIALVAFLAVLIAIVVIVYKDAKKNDMNPILWALVAIFVPNLLGVIIYLIVRGTQKKKSSCYQCGKSIDNEFSICPYCKTEAGIPCTGCGKLLSPQWQTCPYCSQPGGETNTVIKRKDKGLKWIIILVISLVAIPLSLFVALMVLGYHGMNKTSTMEFMSYENNIGMHFDYSAKRFAGEKIEKINVDQEGTLKIYSNIEYESGELNVYLVDEVENEVHAFKQNGKEVFELEVDEGNQYRIIISGKKVAEIKAEFDWVIE